MAARRQEQEFGELRRLVDYGRRVVVYSQDANNATAVRCTNLGAPAYVTKREGPEHLVAAVHAAANGSFGTDTKSSEAFQPGEGAFDRPTDFAQPRTVLHAAAGDDRGDAAGADQAAVLVVVVAAIGVEPARSTPWLPTTPRIGGTASSNGIS